MIQCPNCGAKLQPRARVCVFCQDRFDPDLGPFGVLLILLQALDIALAGFMIYLIGETDWRAPNI